MRKLLAPAIIMFTVLGYSQVGINTTSPQATLDVNGSLRITNTSDITVTSTKLTGLSENGTVRDISIGSNLLLVNNTISAKSGLDYSFGSVTFSVKKNHNVDLLLGPGETNEGKSIIRINNTSGDTEITGIKAGYDGQSLWIYPQSGKIDLLGNDTNSSALNRIEENNKNGGKIYSMIQIVYDGTRGKWIIMQNHD